MSVQFGKWSFAGEPPAAQTVKKIQSLLTPYGPDGTGSYTEGGVVILYGAFHSTSESCGEAQPEITRSGAAIVWDGRLDNRAELVRLLREGLRMGSPDAAIVRAAYERWGTRCFAHLVGDWALSVWNPGDRSLLLAKDPVGTRPLYYTIAERGVSWSSILDPLVLFADKTLALEEEYIAGYLSFFPAVHLTPYSGICSVPPCSFVRIGTGRATVERYWDFDPAKKIRYASDREYEEHFCSVFRESVRRRLRSGAPVLAELSGGLDSSSIVCMADSLAARGSADSPRLDTVSYYDDSEPNWNERPFFSKVEEQRGRTGLHIDVGSQRTLESIFDAGPLRISPSSERAPSLARQKLNAFLTAHGHRVLLSGLGGDEVTGGVPTPTAELGDLATRGEARRLARQLNLWALAQRRPWFHLLGETLRLFLPASLARAPEHLRPAPWLALRFVKRYRSALAGYQSRLHWFGQLPTFQENLATLDALRRQLGADVLPCGPAHEKRYPYLDRDLLEFLFAVPREQLLRPGQRRSLMRRALAGIVPAEVLNRKRKAFVSRRTFVEVSEQFGILLQKLDPMVSASLGIVDRAAFGRELERARVGLETLPVALWRTIGMEAWLRNLNARGLLKCQKISGPEPDIAPNECALRSEAQRSFS
jgi:asparagine synthase (glutamine-hydrolysing)